MMIVASQYRKIIESISKYITAPLGGGIILGKTSFDNDWNPISHPIILLNPQDNDKQNHRHPIFLPAQA